MLMDWGWPWVPRVPIGKRTIRGAIGKKAPIRRRNEYCARHAIGDADVEPM